MEEYFMVVETMEILAIMEEIGIARELIDDINPDVPLLAQGVDSLDFPAIAVAAERKFGVDISDAGAARLKTINDLVRFINEKSG
jgi:acyl carrier protein